MLDFPKLKHLVNIDALEEGHIFEMMETATQYIDDSGYIFSSGDELEGRTIANLFFESSTRTQNSFELAARNLRARVLNVDVKNSAMNKGETLLDTLHTLEAMDVDSIVIRHSEDGVVDWLRERLSRDTTSLINAGDGMNEHPSQALGDLTLTHKEKALRPSTYAFVGDIAHSRVARSWMRLLKKLNANNVRVVGPDAFLPPAEELAALGARAFNNLQEGLKGVDVIVMLRIQRERMDASAFPDTEAYHKQFGLTPESLAFANDDAIFLHPGPVNHGVELAPGMITHPQSRILKQVTYGVAMRMAIFSLILTWY